MKVFVLDADEFLDYFTAIFRGEQAELEMTPNALLPS